MGVRVRVRVADCGVVVADAGVAGMVPAAVALAVVVVVTGV